MTGDRLRDLLRVAATPVVVVTALGPDGPAGATIGSFASVSLDPPLVSFNVTLGTKLHGTLDEDDRVAIHVLADSQEAIAGIFAHPKLSGSEKLALVQHYAHPSGLPVIEDALVVLICRVGQRVSAGDSIIYVAEVESGEHIIVGSPLIYRERGYAGLGSI